MAQTVQQIQAQIAKLQAQADGLRKKEVAGVVERIKEAIEAYGLTAADLGLSTRPGRSVGKVAGKRARVRKNTAAKYGDGNGNIWGGRGPRPQWLRTAIGSGKVLEDFLL